MRVDPHRRVREYYRCMQQAIPVTGAEARPKVRSLSRAGNEFGMALIRGR